MWMPIDLSPEVVAWATRETLAVIIWGTLGLMVLIGVSWRTELPNRDDWDKMV